MQMRTILNKVNQSISIQLIWVNLEQTDGAKFHLTCLKLYGVPVIGPLGLKYSAGDRVRIMLNYA